MKCCLVKYSLVAALSIASAVSAFPSNSGSSEYDHLCAHVVTGIRAHPDNCYEYIQCDRFTAQVQSCPEGQVFSKDSIDCVEGDRAQCRQEAELVVTCGENYFGRMACPGDCGKYYDCASGAAQLEDCLEGYVFYEKFKVCLPGYQQEDTCLLYNA